MSKIKWNKKNNKSDDFWSDELVDTTKPDTNTNSTVTEELKTTNDSLHQHDNGDNNFEDKSSINNNFIQFKRRELSNKTSVRGEPNNENIVDKITINVRRAGTKTLSITFLLGLLFGGAVASAVHESHADFGHEGGHHHYYNYNMQGNYPQTNGGNLRGSEYGSENGGPLRYQNPSDRQTTDPLASASSQNSKSETNKSSNNSSSGKESNSSTTSTSAASSPSDSTSADQKDATTSN